MVEESDELYTELDPSLYHVFASRQSRDCFQKLLQEEIDSLSHMRDYLQKRAKLEEEFAQNLSKLHKTLSVRKYVN